MTSVTGKILVTGPSASGKSTLAVYLREHGVNAFDGDDVRGLAYAVDSKGRRLHRISKEQWRRVDDWRFFWNELKLKRFLGRNPEVVLLGAADNLFDLSPDRLFDRLVYLSAPWPVIWRRLNSPTRGNDWGRDAQPAQREWVRSSVREWPIKARTHGFEFVDATLSPAKILAQLRLHRPIDRGSR